MLAVKKSLTNNNLTIFRRTAQLMSDNFEISVVSNDPVWANKHIDTALDEISRVEKLLSTFSDDSIMLVGPNRVITHDAYFKIITHQLCRAPKDG